MCVVSQAEHRPRPEPKAQLQAGQITQPCHISLMVKMSSLSLVGLLEDQMK